MIDLSLIPPILGVVGLVAAVVIYFIVKGYDEGDGNLKRIADQIHLGAMVFMRREYTMLAIFAGVLLVIYASKLQFTGKRQFACGREVLIPTSHGGGGGLTDGFSDRSPDWFSPGGLA